jgi:hypothetical protein
MFSRKTTRPVDAVKLPNHALLYGIVLVTIGVLVSLGAVTRLYELREFFPLRLPEQVNEFILNYIPFILGTFITTVSAFAGMIVGANWLLSGFREMGRLKVPLRWAGEYHKPEGVSLGLKEGKVVSYDRSPSLIFLILGKFWSNARYVSEISAEIVRRNLRFIWQALFLIVAVHFLFRFLDLMPSFLDRYGLGGTYVIPSPLPFYTLVLVVCFLKLIIALSLIPLKRPGTGREMDSMIVEGRGHPYVFFSILEEGSKIFAHSSFSNKISRSRPIMCDDGETLIGTLIESFPEYLRTSTRAAAHLSLFIGSVMVLFGFLQIILAQYPTFSVGYADFFQLHLMGLLMDIVLNVLIILLGKGFLEQSRNLMSVYRFRSSLVYVEAKGDYEKRVLPELEGIVAPERLFNPLSSCAFNVRYFSAEAISESVTHEGVRELVAMEMSARLAKDVARLKYLPFHVVFRERYPSSWVSYEEGGDESVRIEETPITDEHEGIESPTEAPDAAWPAVGA